MSSSTAGRSVRPIANIDSKSHVNPRMQGGDDHESRMSELYDRLLQPLDGSDECSVKNHSSGNRGDDTASWTRTRANLMSVAAAMKLRGRESQVPLSDRHRRKSMRT